MSTTQIDGGRQIKAATITNAEIATGAAIALSKLAEAVIQADGGQAFTADQSMGGNKLTNLADGTASSDAVNKGQLDAVSQGIDWKASVRVATTVTGTLASAYENGDTVDGVTLATGDRILIKNQSTGSENGIYTVNASGAPTRSTDANTSAKVTSGMAVFVEEGTANLDSGWVLVTDNPIVLGTDALVFTQFTGLGQITAGDGLTKTGNTIDVVGTTNRIVVSANAVDIGTDVVTLTGSQVLTNKTLTTPTIASFANANHDHTNSAGGGQITDAALSSAVTVPKGGTGLTTTTAYGIITGGTTATGNFQNAGTGTEGQVLTGHGSSALPTWEDPAAAYTIVIRETPTGDVDGVNVTFTLANTPIADSEEVFLNGLLQEPGIGNDYTIVAGVITYLSAPLTGDRLRVNYRY